MTSYPVIFHEALPIDETERPNQQRQWVLIFVKLIPKTQTRNFHILDDEASFMFMVVNLGPLIDMVQ